MFPLRAFQRLALGVYVVLAVALWSSGAESQASAREEFAAAQAHYRAGENVEAAEGFLRAYALDPRAPFLHNAFLAWRAAGRPREALEALDRFLAASEQATEQDLERLHEIRAELAAQLEQSADRPAPPSDRPESERPESEGPESEGPESEGPESEGPESEGPESGGDPDTTNPEATSTPTSLPQGAETPDGSSDADAFEPPPIEVGAVVLGLGGAALLWALVENRVVDGIVSSRDAMCTFGPSGTSCPRALDQEAIAREFALHRDLGWSALGVGVALGAIGGTLLGMSLSTASTAPRVHGGCGVGGCSLSVRGTF
jgi:hypothetical protein